MEDLVSYSVIWAHKFRASRTTELCSIAPLQKDMKSYVCRHNRAWHARTYTHTLAHGHGAAFSAGAGPEKASRDPDFKAARESRNPQQCTVALCVLHPACAFTQGVTQSPRKGKRKRGKESLSLIHTRSPSVSLSLSDEFIWSNRPSVSSGSLRIPANDKRGVIASTGGPAGWIDTLVPVRSRARSRDRFPSSCPLVSNFSCR